MPCHGPVHLRRATIADAAGIATVYLAGWQGAHAGLVSADYAACMRARAREESWREELAKEAPHRTPWVALIDDRVVGFASGGMSRDDDVDASTAEVYQVYVDPECWGRGIGSSLLRHVVRDLHDHGFARADLWVVAGCEPAKAFMERHTWVPAGSTRLEECGAAQVELRRYQHALR
jgi:GNAT superfamily N-acetyltransferase